MTLSFRRHVPLHARCRRPRADQGMQRQLLRYFFRQRHHRVFDCAGMHELSTAVGANVFAFLSSVCGRLFALCSIAHRRHHRQAAKNIERKTVADEPPHAAAQCLHAAARVGLPPFCPGVRVGCRAAARARALIPLSRPLCPWHRRLRRLFWQFLHSCLGAASASDCCAPTFRQRWYLDFGAGALQRWVVSAVVLRCNMLGGKLGLSSW